MGILDEPHADRIDVCFIERDFRVSGRDFPGFLEHEASGLPKNVGFFNHGHRAPFVRPGVFESRLDDAGASLAGHDPRRDGDIGGGNVDKRLHFGIRRQSVPHNIGQRMKLHAGVHPLGVFTENHEVDAVPVVQGVAGIGLAGAKRGVKIELLAQADDGAEIRQALAPEGRIEFGGGVVLGLGGDGTEKAGVGFLQKGESAVGKGVSLAAPEFPADVAGFVFGIESDFLQHDHGGFHDFLSDSVSRENGDFVLRHDELLVEFRELLGPASGILMIPKNGVPNQQISVPSARTAVQVFRGLARTRVRV